MVKSDYKLKSHRDTNRYSSNASKSLTWKCTGSRLYHFSSTTVGSKDKAFPTPPNWCFCVGWVVEQNRHSCFFRNNNPHLFSHLQSTPRNSAGRGAARASTYTHFVIDTTYTSDCYHFRSCWHLPCKAVLGKFASFSPILLFLFKGGQAVSVVSVTL